MKTTKKIAEALASPCSSNWLRESLRAAAGRDAVDALRDAERLALLLKEQWESWLAEPSEVVPFVRPAREFVAGASYVMRSSDGAEWVYKCHKRAPYRRLPSVVAVWLDCPEKLRVIRCGIHTGSDGGEMCFPLGQYSRCPVLRASNIIREVEA